MIPQAPNCNSRSPSKGPYRGPASLLLHGKGDSAARDPLLTPLGVQAGQGVPVPAGHPGEVDEVVMQRLLLHGLEKRNRKVVSFKWLISGAMKSWLKKYCTGSVVMFSA